MPRWTNRNFSATCAFHECMTLLRSGDNPVLRQHCVANCSVTDAMLDAVLMEYPDTDFNITNDCNIPNTLDGGAATGGSAPCSPSCEAEIVGSCVPGLVEQNRTALPALEACIRQINKGKVRLVRAGCVAGCTATDAMIAAGGGGGYCTPPCEADFVHRCVPAEAERNSSAGFGFRACFRHVRNGLMAQAGCGDNCVLTTAMQASSRYVPGVSPGRNCSEPCDDTPRDDTPRDDTPRDDTPPGESLGHQHFGYNLSVAEGDEAAGAVPSVRVILCLAMLWAQQHRAGS